MKASLQFPQILRSDILSDLPSDLREDILDQCAIRVFRRGQFILRQGERSEGLYFVAHGLVQISQTSPDGEVTVIHHAGPGETMGEVEAIADRPCVADCMATVDATVLLYPTPLLFSAVGNKVFLRNIMRVNHTRLERDNASKHMVTFSTVEQRLCTCLLQLAGRDGEITRNQSYIADAVGCSRQSVNKELSRLKERGLLVTEKRVIRLIDMPGLRALAQGVADADAPAEPSANAPDAPTPEGETAELNQ